MYGRFTLTESRCDLENFFDGKPDHDSIDERTYQSSYNIPPSIRIPGASIGKDGGRQLDLYRWGLIPSWVENLSSFQSTTDNARAESVADKPMYRTAFRSQAF